MCFRCGLEDYFIANYPEPDTLDKKVHQNTEKPKTHVYKSIKIDKTSENSIYKIESQKIHLYVAPMSSNAERTRRYFGDSSQLTNWIVDSGETCHITPDISNNIPGSLVETDKYVEVSYRYFSQRNKEEKFK